MKWILIDKKNTEQPPPRNGKSYVEYEYRDWKEILAKEGKHQCVYCCISDSRMGIYNFQVEHFLPKSKYAHLEHVITNLFYTCPICNKFKGNDWFFSGIKKNFFCHYPDPSVKDYNTLFSVDENGKVSGNGYIAKYLVIKLALNRNQLIMERRHVRLLNKFKACREKFDLLRQKLMASDNILGSRHLLNELFKFSANLEKLKDQLINSSPYTKEDTKKL